MGDKTMALNGLLCKISSLFNSPLYSDVQFVFTNENGTDEKIYCHKLILALQSKAFAHLLFEDKKSRSVIKMQASKMQLFYLLFKFLYTNDVQFHSFNEAQDLCELASDYYIDELVKRCHDYMFQSKLTIENIFLSYDHALKIHNEMLLKDCRNFICSNVFILLQPDEFSKASHAVVDDIVKLDILPLTTELEIINAVLNWGSENLIKLEIPYNEQNLRKSIDPFLKHLRILSLSASEFQELVGNYNIFSAYESTIIIKEIIMPACNSELSENFCRLTSKRGATVLSREISCEYQQDYLTINNSEKTVSPKSVQSDPPKFLEYQHYHLNTKSSSINTDPPKFLDQQYHLNTKSSSINTDPPKFLEHQQYHLNTKSSSINTDPPKSVGLNPLVRLEDHLYHLTTTSSAKTESPKSVRSDPPKSLNCNASNKIAYQVRKHPAKNTSISSSKYKQNFFSSPNILDLPVPTPSFSQNLLRDLEFPLRECEKEFSLSFQDDIKCYTTIKMKSGNLSLYGFELKIKSKNESKEELEVSVDLRGFSTKYCESHNVELRNNLVCITFPKPLNLQEGKKGHLEISIEDLYLHRCSQTDKKLYEFNCGLNFESEICIDSNKKGNERNFLFLINKLIYAPF